MRAYTKAAFVFLVVFALLSSSVGFSHEFTSHNSPQTLEGSENLSEISFPSYLFLNNWINSSAWIYTGVPDHYLYLSGPLTVSDISLNESVAPVSITINNGNESSRAYLNENNTIQAFQSNAEETLVYPPGSDQFNISQTSNGPFTDTINISENASYSLLPGVVKIYTNPEFEFFNNATKIESTKNSGQVSINLTFSSGYSYIDVGINNATALNLTDQLSLNNREVSHWLESSSPVKFNGSILHEYYMSLLLVKDDQNPYTGEFVASPSPLYLYSWVRDGSFAAISMESSGHVNTALKYWRWMAKEEGNDSVAGTWSTRFNFWNGDPDANWVNPEYDSVGIFQIGIYNLYKVTKNASIIEPFLPTINASLTWEENSISSKGLLPEDYSIWEDVDGYNFWTQAVDAVGMNYTGRMYADLNLSHASINENASKLDSSIMKYFLQKDNSMFAEYLEPLLGNSNSPYSPVDIYDSSTILPVTLGLINPNSSMAHKIVGNIVKNLTKEGGVARFYGDTYHYSGFPSDSSGPMPPWIITTMFEAYYDEIVGNNAVALSLLNWATNHTQAGLLPEALNPENGTPLPTTSPLTWSSAMFILVALNYNKVHVKPSSLPLVLYTIIGIAIAIVAVASVVLVRTKINKSKYR
jgi:glucoamylase